MGNGGGERFSGRGNSMDNDSEVGNSLVCLENGQSGRKLAWSQIVSQTEEFEFYPVAMVG